MIANAGISMMKSVLDSTSDFLAISPAVVEPVPT